MSWRSCAPLIECAPSAFTAQFATLFWGEWPASARAARTAFQGSEPDHHDAAAAAAARDALAGLVGADDGPVTVFREEG